MRCRLLVEAAMVAALDTAYCATGSAREPADVSSLAQPLAAPGDALELKVGTGYTQGFGNVAPGRPMADVGGAGLGVSADIDFRLTPWLSLGFEGQYQQFESEQNSAARGTALDFAATYHFQPVTRGDAWVRLGSGYRWLWENDPRGVTGLPEATGLWAERIGLDLLTAKIGYDLRASQDAAFGPLLGAGLTTFVWEQYSTGRMHLLSPVQVASFIFAGVEARFDIGGSRGGLDVGGVQQGAALKPWRWP
jgi:hypothetical protein